MSEETAMVFRGFCVHGKVRAMTVDDTLTTQHCLKDLKEIKRKAARIDHVPVEVARKSDMRCDECDAKRTKLAGSEVRAHE